LSARCLISLEKPFGSSGELNMGSLSFS
jgi:hypothetical protein